IGPHAQAGVVDGLPERTALEELALGLGNMAEAADVVVDHVIVGFQVLVGFAGADGRFPRLARTAEGLVHRTFSGSDCQPHWCFLILFSPHRGPKPATAIRCLPSWNYMVRVASTH